MMVVTSTESSPCEFTILVLSGTSSEITNSVFRFGCKEMIVNSKDYRPFFACRGEAGNISHQF